MVEPQALEYTCKQLSIFFSVQNQVNHSFSLSGIYFYSPTLLPYSTMVNLDSNCCFQQLRVRNESSLEKLTVSLTVFFFLAKTSSGLPHVLFFISR